MFTLSPIPSRLIPMLLIADTVETAYKVYVCPRGNLLYMQIYLITNLKLLSRAYWGLNLSTL